ncbi:hypothetical protein ZIOFF_018494 [Zingiber officinale]|uniref:Uncharacterized protein n=1 Tax=Zingiber officinale TaxID=94328 RepID=A0A8J5HGH0_ZINOF|nr:hypothetical protein ZIOFF_018494 [Zingiber officinale]
MEIIFLSQDLWDMIEEGYMERQDQQDSSSQTGEIEKEHKKHVKKNATTLRIIQRGKREKIKRGKRYQSAFEELDKNYSSHVEFGDENKEDTSLPSRDKTLGIKYLKEEDNKLVGFCDSDWAGSLDDRRSTSAYMFCLGSKIISWSSKKQSSVALSSAEVEYIAANEAVREVVCASQKLKDLKFDSNLLFEEGLLHMFGLSHIFIPLRISFAATMLQVSMNKLLKLIEVELEPRWVTIVELTSDEWLWNRLHPRSWEHLLGSLGRGNARQELLPIVRVNLSTISSYKLPKSIHCYTYLKIKQASRVKESPNPSSYVPYRVKGFLHRSSQEQIQVAHKLDLTLYGLAAIGWRNVEEVTKDMTIHTLSEEFLLNEAKHMPQLIVFDQWYHEIWQARRELWVQVAELESWLVATSFQELLTRTQKEMALAQLEIDCLKKQQDDLAYDQTVITQLKRGIVEALMERIQTTYDLDKMMWKVESLKAENEKLK